MLLLDLSHTSHTQARTGVQRVCRSLHTALTSRAEGVRPVTHDPYRGVWRTLTTDEDENLRRTAPAPKRSARWPWRKRAAGHLSRFLNRRPPALPPATGLIVPEIFGATTALALPEIFAAVRGPRVALFHDAIALKFPELSPSKTVARFPAYLRELLVFDGVAAVSEDSRLSLLDYWRWLGLTKTPPVVALPLGLDPAPYPRDQLVAGDSALLPVILSVGSVEGRKNHGALLDACERLWTRGVRFELHLVGLAQVETGRVALEKIRALQSAGRPVRYDGAVDEESLEEAYARCVFTVYPSLMEGFGLPVLESLARGKPCVCSARGALGESARGGGCLLLDRVDSPALAIAIESLLASNGVREGLLAEAKSRQFKTWSAYASELVAWMAGLNVRA